MIVLLSSDILKVKVCSCRDGSSEHHDCMDIAECTSGIKAPSLSPTNSLDEQVVPQSSTTPSKEPTRYVFQYFFFPSHLYERSYFCRFYILLFWSKTFLLIFYYYYFKRTMMLPACTKHNTTAQMHGVLCNTPRGYPGPSSKFVR